MNAPETSISTKNPVAKISAFLEKFKPQMALALPKHLTADRMVRLALTAFSTTQKLQDCDPKTIAASIMTASTLGLEIGVDGQGFLVPYKGICTFVPGWKGLVDLVSRSGRGTVWTGAVFDGDEFDYAMGDSPFVRHKPGNEDDPSKLIYVYAIGRAKGSDFPIIEVWPIEKVRKHRNKYNKVGDKHYSYRDWEMYARKIPLLQVIKYMPKSIELSNALAVSYAAEEGNMATIDGDFVTVTEVDHTDADDKKEEKEIGPYSQSDFDKNLPSWTKLIAKGKPADDIIKMVSTKGAMTDEQVATLRAIKPEVVEQSQSAKYLARIAACSDVDVLDTLIDEARDLPDYDQIKTAYSARRAELTKE